MNNTNWLCSLDDTTELRNLIIENPDLPLLVFVGDEDWCGEWYYQMAHARCGGIQELTVYDGLWLDEDDYRDKLTDDLCDEEEYVDLSDEDYFKMIDQKIAETEFVKAIVIYVG